MRKVLLLCITILLAVNLYAVSDDYIAGYQAGYSDAQNSKETKYPISRHEDRTSMGI